MDKDGVDIGSNRNSGAEPDKVGFERKGDKKESRLKFVIRRVLAVLFIGGFFVVLGVMCYNHNKSKESDKESDSAAKYFRWKPGEEGEWIPREKMTPEEVIEDAVIRQWSDIEIKYMNAAMPEDSDVKTFRRAFGSLEAKELRRRFNLRPEQLLKILGCDENGGTLDSGSKN